MDAWGRGEGGHFRQRRIPARRCGCDMAGAVMSCQCDCTEVCGVGWERGQGDEQGPITKPPHLLPKTRQSTVSRTLSGVFGPTT